MKKIFLRILSVLVLLISFTLVFLYGCAFVVYKSDNYKSIDILTLSLLETSAAKFVPGLFLSDEQIELILIENAVNTSNKITDASLISIDPENIGKDLEFIEISGATFKGRMIIIPDPSRVYLATPTWGFNSSQGGMTVTEFIERDGAIAGINAGGFSDSKGTGNGSKPTGYVIQNGEITYGTENTVDCVTGFDENYKLIVGRMSAQEALDIGIKEGFCFNLGDVSALIVDGEPVSISGTGSGLNPRTAIGQKADGTIILLSIDGRQAHSLGAVYQDLIQIFLDYDVINASNLDGGSSSVMVYQNETVSVSSSLYGERSLPTAILVK
ncbi:MAG: phosphodiester glycosidase family protein [Clostridia bacterium]